MIGIFDYIDWTKAIHYIFCKSTSRSPDSENVSILYTIFPYYNCWFRNYHCPK